MKTLVECAVVGGTEDASMLIYREHRQLSHRFPRELHVAQLVGGIRKFAFDVGDEDRRALGIVGRDDE